MLQIKETGALVAEQNFAERIKVVGSKKRLVKKRENLEVVVSDSGRVSRVKRIENFVLSPNRVVSTDEDEVKGSTVFFIKSRKAPRFFICPWSAGCDIRSVRGPP